MIKTVLFNPSIDVYYKISKFGVQTTFTSLESSAFPAGKAINFAKAVKVLGEDVEVLGTVAKDDASKFQRFLDKKKIFHNLHVTQGYTRINTTVFEEESRLTYHFNSENADCTPHESEFLAFCESLPAQILSGDFVAFSGSVQKGLDKEIYKKLIEECKKRNAKTALDTRDEPLKYGIAATPLVVKPNERELGVLFSDEIKGLRHIILKAKRLLDSGIKFVFVTLGKNGAVAINGDECLLVSPPEIPNQVNTVGCGDAFLAGAVVGIMRNFPFDEICRLAVSCGAANSLSHEPGDINKDMIWRIMEKVKTESV